VESIDDCFGRLQTIGLITNPEAQRRLKRASRLPGIMVVNLAGTVMGFVVDAVSEVLRIPAGTVAPPPPVMETVDAEYLSGVGKLEDRLLILVDLEKIMGASEMFQIRETRELAA